MSDAAAPPVRRIAVPAINGANIWRETVAPTARSISISLIKFEIDRTGEILEAEFSEPLMSSLEPRSREAVVLMW